MRITFLNKLPRNIQLTLSTIICSSILSLLPAVRMMREASGKSDSSMYVTGICDETCNICTKNSDSFSTENYRYYFHFYKCISSFPRMFPLCEHYLSHRVVTHECRAIVK